MVGIGMASASGDPNSFVFGDYGQTQADNRAIATSGILGILSYGFGFLGATTFLQFALYAFHSGKPETRNADYYRSRSTFYNFLLFVAGFSQLFLGCYLLARFGRDLQSGPVAVAMYVVRYPSISVLVGLVQVLNALWGLARARGFLVPGESWSRDVSYQASIGLGWFLQLVLQVIVQPASLPPQFAAAAPAVAALSLGLNLMPAFLDYKARNLPAYPQTLLSYYGLEESHDEAGKMQQQEDPEAPSTDNDENENGFDDLSI